MIELKMFWKKYTDGNCLIGTNKLRKMSNREYDENSTS